MVRILALRIGLLSLSACAVLRADAGFSVQAADPAPWATIFGSIGLERTANDATIRVVGTGSGGGAGDLAKLDLAKLAADHILILEGAVPGSAQLGITPRIDQISIRQIRDIHAPNTQIIWAQTVLTSGADLTGDYQIFARDRWSGRPVLAGKKTRQGAILWLATSPGASGIERYPYLLQALADLDFTPPAQATNLWAFFDSAYRSRADVEYLARRWRQAGISALHIAAWHNMEPDDERDLYLRGLIAACHRNAILTYAWLELPHVSEKFWADHPEWREKTGLGQDAKLDWRKLMNLEDPACRKAVEAQVQGLLERFDWDGVNLAELYFESLEGVSNPSRFTPMNDNVRAAFKQSAGLDPKLLFDPASANAAGRDPASLRKFLDFRAHLVTEMQSQWMDTAMRIRERKPWLDIVLTHIDDRFEPGVRDALGADVAKTLPLAEARGVKVIIEDPAPLWNLGAERYTQLAAKYAELTPNKPAANFAVDINIVDRYQDVYPTKKQTGVELFELVHSAAASFYQVALYFESSLEKQDLMLLPAAATMARITHPTADELDVTTPQACRILWTGAVEMDGKPWPVQSPVAVLTPAGHHRLTPGVSSPGAPAGLHISDFNGDVQTAQTTRTGVELAYKSQTRAIATLDAAVTTVEVDGSLFWLPIGGEKPQFFVLPAGQHLVTFRR
jgi:hypothetical protein